MMAMNPWPHFFGPPSILKDTDGPAVVVRHGMQDDCDA